MVKRLVLATLLSAGLAACGGGGGGGTTTPATPPAAPTAVTAVAGDQYVKVDGTVDPAATAVNLYWKVGTGVTKSNGAKLVVTTAPQWHTGLTNGQQYCYVVTAVVGGVESADSAEACATPAAVNMAVDDPFFAEQWHLLSTGTQAGASGVAAAGEDVRAQGAWTQGYKGQGVRIAVVDDGIEAYHEDLASNMGANGLSYNYVTGTSDPSNDPTDTTSGHGTMCAGIAAARDLNGVGGNGVAPRATMVGYNATLNLTSSNETDAMTRNAADVSVSSNSWGAADGTGELAASSSTWKSAITTGLTTGRGGKGILYFWAAGNGRSGGNACANCSDNSNYDGRANYRGVMAVGAVNDQGLQSSYSESGANLWVSAPGGEFCSTHTITTTDRTGTLGHNSGSTAGDYTNGNYTKCMNGTSSATPGAAGVAALVLSAKPTLGWRDVRIILAQSARQNNAGDAGWFTNGGGYHFNTKYGFGVVDANAAVTAALAYGTNVGTELTYTTPTTTVNGTIADTATSGTYGTATISTMNVTTSPTIASIEWVEATVTITAGPGAVANSYYSGDFGIQLTGPSGATTMLALPHVCAADNFGACTTTYTGWVFGDAAHLGEAANGNWTLAVADAIKGGATGTLVSWKLKFYGH
ncbi:MAG: S8 family serine peptidase [Nitrosomonadales bacterium]|nr:S8 family serine peptidase [Nitrosomonadales bacterium]